MDVNHPGSQEDVVSSCEPAPSLVEGALSGAEIVAAPCLLALAVESLPLCHRVGRGSLLVFAQSFVLCCEMARLCIRLLS